jgi:MiaB-like tRNA modifying enzyme
MIRLSDYNKDYCKSSEITALKKSALRNVYVENYGCPANKFDLNIMIAYLLEAGYQVVKNLKLADVILINTCGVKQPTEDRIINKIRLLNLHDKPLIITGCLPKINMPALRKAAPNFSAVLDPRSIDKILPALISTQNNEKNKMFFSNTPLIKLNLPNINPNPIIEIVSIAEGCDGECSFCCVRFARGRLFSYPINEILKKVNRAVMNGVKEVWLTSQDNGAYGLDIDSNIANLIEECSSIQGNFKIRVGMMNPNHVYPILSELINAFKNEKVFKFLHIPLQSGDDEVLKQMNRKYTIEEFQYIVQRFREEIPEIVISTDVICGFPGETKKAFENTIQIINKIQPDIVNISKFFSRPNTKAERLRKINSNEVKNRSKRLANLVRKNSLKIKKKLVGWKGEILVDEKGKGFSWIGRDITYKPIVIKSRKNMLGSILRVEIIKAFPTYLEAKIINKK